MATATGAGAATVHRLSISQTTGSEGAQTVLQNTASGSALQGEVGGTSANSGIAIPFGILGEYDPPNPVFGVGVIGISATGYAVAGESVSSQPSLLGYAGGMGDGVQGVTTANSPANGLSGYAKGTGAGVYGEGTNTNGTTVGGLFFNDAAGPALQTSSSGGDGGDFFSGGNAFGVYGENDGAGTGLFGDNGSTATPSPGSGENANSGILGQSATGPGIFANNTSSATPGPDTGTTDVGLYAAAAAGPALVGNSETPNGGTALLGLVTGEGVEAYGYSGNSHPVLAAYDGEGGSDLIGAYGCSKFVSGDVCTQDAESFIVQTTSANRSNPLTTLYPAAADVQVSGDLYVFGEIYSQCGAFPATKTTDCHDGVESSGYGPSSVTRSAGGANVRVYGAAQSVHTIEDLGQAQLVGGHAYVRLDPAFARTTEPGAPYMVFVTPEGDSRGVYTTTHTLGGFEVRENAGGRSTMTFDYRIVAKPLGDTSQRFAAIEPRKRVAAYNAQTHAAFKKLSPRFAHVKHVARRPHVKHRAALPLMPLIR